MLPLLLLYYPLQRLSTQHPWQWMLKSLALILIVSQNVQAQEPNSKADATVLPLPSTSLSLDIQQAYQSDIPPPFSAMPNQVFAPPTTGTQSIEQFSPALTDERLQLPSFAYPLESPSKSLKTHIELLTQLKPSQSLQAFPSPTLQTDPPSIMDLSLETLENSVTVDSTTKNRIVILKVVDYRNDTHLKIDSNSRINLNETVLQALKHEVPLHFTIQIQLTETNQLLGVKYQRKRKEIDYTIKLEAFGLKQQYRLSNSRNGQVQTFQQLEAALDTLTTIKGFNIAELSELHPRQTYRLKMRIHLNRWKLPAPLLLETLFQPQWQLDSQWFETYLTAPQSWQ